MRSLGFSFWSRHRKGTSKVLKQILKIKTQTPSASIYGELGRVPLIVKRKERILKYWLKVKFSSNTLLQHAYINEVNIMNLAINEAVSNAVSTVEKNVVGPLKKRNKELTQKLEKVESELKTKETLINKQESEIKDLHGQLLVQDQKLDELEQYGRRSSIRLFNLPSEPTTNCEEAVVKLCNETLKVNISPEDIERCHPLGAKQVICKFRSYKTKAEVYSAKKYLKGNPRKIFLTEDLTRRNHKIVEELLKLRKSGRIHSFWTIDGKIYFKAMERARPQRVTTESEIETKLSEEPVPVMSRAMEYDQQNG